MRAAVAGTLRYVGVYFVVSLAATAAAEPPRGIALDPLAPAPPGDDFVAIPSPHAVGTPADGRFGVAFGYTRNPLRLDSGSDANHGSLATVSRQALMHAMGSLALFDRALVSVHVPFALAQSGDGSTASGGITPPSGVAAGDVRVGLRVRLYGEPRTAFQIGTGVEVFLPAGNKSQLLGEGGFRENVYVSLGGRFAAGVEWIYGASGGFYVRQSSNPSAFRYGAGFAARLFGRWQFGPELLVLTPVQRGALELASGTRVATTGTSHVELLFGSRVRVWRVEVGVLAGPGLTRAVGTPQYRLLGTLALRVGASENTAPPDRDGDGVADRDDACPSAHGPKSTEPSRNGCPVLDDDEDGVPNHRDACPEEPADPDAKGAAPGCS